MFHVDNLGFMQERESRGTPKHTVSDAITQPHLPELKTISNALPDLNYHERPW